MRSRSILSALVLFGAAYASADYTLVSSYTYSITANVGTAYIRDLEFNESVGFVGSAPSGGLSTSFYNNLADDGTQSSNSGTLTVSYPFGPGTPEPYLANSLFFGIIEGLPTDASPTQKHLVLFMDPTSASNVENIAFGTVFPTTNEDSLINAIEQVHRDDLSDADKEPFYDQQIHPFYDAAANALAGTGNTIHRSAYFGGGSDFSIVLFSSGQIVGSGTSSFEAVPEPTPLLALGAGAIGFLRRRRRRS